MVSNFRVIEIVTMIWEIKKCKVDIKIFTNEIYMSLDQSVSRRDFLRMRYSSSG